MANSMIDKPRQRGRFISFVEGKAKGRQKKMGALNYYHAR
jgi:hypothetical protein